MSSDSQAQGEATTRYKEGEATKRYHLWLYERDIEWIDSNIEKVKRSKFVRVALRRMIRSIQERSAQYHEALHSEDLNDQSTSK